jgi:hypothetical protein
LERVDMALSHIKRSLHWAASARWAKRHLETR